MQGVYFLAIELHCLFAKPSVIEILSYLLIVHNVYVQRYIKTTLMYMYMINRRFYTSCCYGLFVHWQCL